MVLRRHAGLRTTSARTEAYARPSTVARLSTPAPMPPALIPGRLPRGALPAGGLVGSWVLRTG